MRASLQALLTMGITTAIPLAAAAQSDTEDSSVPPAPDQPKYTIRDAFPPLSPANPAARLPHWTIYGHPSPPYPRYTGAWGTGWKAWKPSGGVDRLGYWYQYHTHVPGIGVKYYRGPVATYYPGPYGVSPATGLSHYGYGPLGW